MYDWQRETFWQSSTLNSGAKRNHWVLLALAAVVIGLAMPGTLAIPDELRKGNWAILSVLLFQLVGAGFAIAAIRAWLAWRRYGEVRLHMDPWPGAIGGAIAGHFELSRALPPNHDIAVSLECLRQQRGHRNNHVSTQWKRDVKLQPMSALERHVWFHFEVPADLPACSPRDSSHYKWTLTLHVRQPGPDLQRRFDIPVFEGTQDNAHARRKARTIAPQHDENIAKDLNLYRRHNGMSLSQPAGRGWKLALGLFLFGIICLGSATFLWHVGSIAALMSVVFGLCAVLILLASIWTLGQRRDVLLGSDIIATRLYWFVLPITSRRVAPSEVERLDWVRSGSSNSGTRSTVYYTLQLQLKADKPVVLCRGLQGEEYTASAAQLLSRETGIPARTLSMR